MKRALVMSAALAAATASPLAAQDGSEITSSRTPENAVKFLNLLASQNKISVRPYAATQQTTFWDVACGNGECWLGTPTTNITEAWQATSKFQMGELAACKSTLSISNENQDYKANAVEQVGEGRVHTMAFRKYTVKIPGPITSNYWIKAVRDLENHEFDWSKVQKVSVEKQPYSVSLRISNSGTPGGGIILQFGDNEELATRAQLALDVIVKSCDPLAGSAF